jgi:transcriptional regulator with GAF, ATPase, and Fis domain/energy-coupling factor transporter ATP-binding protein EcfA2
MAGSVFLRFEKKRLLHHSKHAELIEGSLSGRPFIFKKFLSGHVAARSHFAALSGIHHRLLLTPELSGVSKGNHVCYGMPLSFVPSAVPVDADLSSFVIEFLSLAVALHSRGHAFRWSPHHLLYDAAQQRVLLAGLNSIRKASSTELDEESRRILSELCRRLPGGERQPVAGRLRQWSRRKEAPLAGCLHELLAVPEFQPDRTITRFEWAWTREQEVLRGLSHLAGSSRGQSVLFYGDRGSGKSTLCKQAAAAVAERGAVAVSFAFPVDAAPCRGLRRWTEHVLDAVGYRWSEGRRWVQEIGSPEFSPESFAVEFVAAIRKAVGDSLPVLLLDDVHHCDPVSRGCLDIICKMANNERMLLALFTADGSGGEDSAVRIEMQPVSRSVVESSYHVPFWKPEQKKSYLDQLYARTSGNPMLTKESLEDVIRERHDSLHWENRQWSFREHEIPVMTGSLPDLYRQLPGLTAEELWFLQRASLQEGRIDAGLIKTSGSDRERLIRLLTAKGILATSGQQCTFSRPMVAEAVYRQIDATERLSLHAELAAELELRNDPGLFLNVARNYLRAGNALKALAFVCRAPEQGGSALLAVFRELEEPVRQMEQADQFRFYQARGDVQFRTGNYAAGVRSYGLAHTLAREDASLRFRLGVAMARCHLFNNDIHAAHQVLREHTSMLREVSDPEVLMQYYFGRAAVAQHRGLPSKNDLEQAMSFAEKLQDHGALALSYRQQAELAWHSGRLDEARELARKALRLALRAGSLDNAGHALKVLGSVASRKSQHAVAVRLLTRSLRLFQKLENGDGQARVWNMLGNLYLDRSQFSRATHGFRNALALFSELDHPLELGLARFNLGRVLIEQGKLREAEEVFSRCAEADRKAGSKRDYAFDLRAVAAACLLQGHYRKAERRLKRAAELFAGLQLEHEVLQTNLIQMQNELEQGNLKQASLLLQSLENRIADYDEPGTLADLHYLAGNYFLQSKDRAKALSHLQKSLRFARKGKNQKLTGQCLILQLVARGTPPAGDDAELRRALRLLKKSGNEIETADHLLKLYNAFPVLLETGVHRNRLARFADAYRKARNQKRLNEVRGLMEHGSGQKATTGTLYESWPRLLDALQSDGPLENRLQQLLSALREEMGAGFALLQYLTPHGVYENVRSGASPDAAREALRLKILQMVHQTPRGMCLDLSRDPEYATSGSLHSVIAVPIRREDQVHGMWCFERDEEGEPFGASDLNRVSFFLTAVSPVVEAALSREFRAWEQERPSGRRYENLIGSSSRMRELYRRMEKVAAIDISVLIEGESGTGKELIARNIHSTGSRASGPFVALNCSAIPETLIESELFGFNKGAFTGAVQSKPGVIEKADGGTLFLDEIGDLSPAAQAKLLRVIQEREIQRLGDTSVRKVNVRFLFATHKDLKRLAKDGGYRQDLYYRISSYTLEVPPVRDRDEDIPALIEHFAGRYGESFGRTGVRFTPAAMKTLSEYPWPGNVREMENLIQTLLVNTTPGSRVDVRDLPEQVRGAGVIRRQSGKSLDAARHEFEREFLTQALKENRWNKTQTAKQLLITRQGLINLIQRLKIETP